MIKPVLIMLDMPHKYRKTNTLNHSTTIIMLTYSETKNATFELRATEPCHWNAACWNVIEGDCKKHGLPPTRRNGILYYSQMSHGSISIGQTGEHVYGDERVNGMHNVVSWKPIDGEVEAF